MSNYSKYDNVTFDDQFKITNSSNQNINNIQSYIFDISPAINSVQINTNPPNFDISGVSYSKTAHFASLFADSQDSTLFDNGYACQSSMLYCDRPSLDSLFVSSLDFLQNNSTQQIPKPNPKPKPKSKQTSKSKTKSKSKSKSKNPN